MWWKNLRLTMAALGAANLIVIALGTILLLVSSSCNHRRTFPFMIVTLISIMRLFTIFKIANAQEAAAKTIVDSPPTVDALDIGVRNDRRVKYKRLLLWTRIATVISVVQLMAATCLVISVGCTVSGHKTSSQCVLELAARNYKWKHKVMGLFMIVASSIAILQFFVGFDVLQWRSFYKCEDGAWQAHYHEVFDQGIREALCCLGRFEYFVLEEDEVYSVARLLGELVTYRATGAGHMELLAGLALLQKHSQFPNSYEGYVEAPLDHLQAAFSLHKFAEAAYTGILLDLGRNAVLFPCSWLYRQGILSPCNHNRRPILTGDNWWRGHAAAFLNFINLSPEVLRRGRVCQKRCEAAYFIVVLHHMRSVVIAIRGTEGPEDLITDGLGKESPLSFKDLDGLINCNHIHPDIRQHVESSFPHYGHFGAVEAARDLYKEIEGNPDHVSESVGFLSSLLGPGCECDGYDVRLVGHSLGGAIATLLGLRLYNEIPNLHVYTYGPFPCVDLIVADACSQFVTSIIHDSEFSARLSVGSIMRLRAASISALSDNTRADTTLISRLARRFLYVSESQKPNLRLEDSTECFSQSTLNKDPNHNFREGRQEREQECSLWNEIDRRENDVETVDDEFTNPFAVVCENQLDDPISEFMEIVPNSENQSTTGPPEMFLPGLLIHMVPEKRNFGLLSWVDKKQTYKAFIVDRECFKDIVISPSMFLDHLPWRCHRAMRKVLEARSEQDLLNVAQVV